MRIVLSNLAHLHDAADVGARVRSAQHAREVAQRQRALGARTALRQPHAARHQRDLPARAHHLANLHTHATRRSHYHNLFCFLTHTERDQTVCFERERLMSRCHQR